MAPLEKSTDSELLALVRGGDRAAFAQLYRRYWDTLLDTAFQRLKSVEAAEEVVQDVFVSFFLRREEIELKSGLPAYLKTALKYKVFNHYRAQQLHYRHLDKLIWENEATVPALPDELLERKLLRERIQQAAGKMPGKCREAFLLSRFEQLSHQDIALRMDISLSTVKKHITKAMRIMRTEFGGHETDMLLLLLWLSVSR